MIVIDNGKERRKEERIAKDVRSKERVEEFGISEMRKGDLEVWIGFHGLLCGFDRVRIARPSASRDAVVNVPSEHQFRPSSGVLASVEHKPESTIHSLAESNTASVVQSDPRCAFSIVSHQTLSLAIKREREIKRKEARKPRMASPTKFWVAMSAQKLLPS